MAGRPTIQVVKTNAVVSPQHYIRLLGGNGEIVLTSELYSTKGNALKAARRLKRWIPFARFDADTIEVAKRKPEPEERIGVVGNTPQIVEQWIQRNHGALIGGTSLSAGVLVRGYHKADQLRGANFHTCFVIGSVLNEMRMNVELATRLGDNPRIIPVDQAETLPSDWRTR